MGVEIAEHATTIRPQGVRTTIDFTLAKVSR